MNDINHSDDRRWIRLNPIWFVLPTIGIGNTFTYLPQEKQSVSLFLNIHLRVFCLHPNALKPIGIVFEVLNTFKQLEISTVFSETISQLLWIIHRLYCSLERNNPNQTLLFCGLTRITETSVSGKSCFYFHPFKNKCSMLFAQPFYYIYLHCSEVEAVLPNMDQSGSN